MRALLLLLVGFVLCLGCAGGGGTGTTGGDPVPPQGTWQGRYWAPIAFSERTYGAVTMTVSGYTGTITLTAEDGSGEVGTGTVSFQDANEEGWYVTCRLQINGMSASPHGSLFYPNKGGTVPTPTDPSGNPIHTGYPLFRHLRHPDPERSPFWVYFREPAG